MKSNFSAKFYYFYGYRGYWPRQAIGFRAARKGF